VTTMTAVAMPLASDSHRAADFDSRNASGNPGQVLTSRLSSALMGVVMPTWLHDPASPGG
jgi:hypothetical protein